MDKAMRITKAQRFTDMIALLNGEPAPNGSTVADLEAFATHEIELLARKNSTPSKKEKAAQEADATRKSLIVDFLAALDPSSDGMTCSEIGRAIDELAELSTSKMASLCNGLVKEGTVTKASVKGKTLFKLAA